MLANDWPMEELPTLPEVCEAQTKRIAQLESQLAAANLQAAKVVEAHRKIKERSAAASKARTAAGRALKESVAAARADATQQAEARFQQRHTKEMDALELTFDEALTESQAAERRAEAELEQAQAELVELEQARTELGEARDEAKAALDEKEKFNRLRNAANAAKRTAESACEKAEKLSTKRLRRAEAAEAELGEAREKLAAYAEHYAAASEAKRKYSEIGEQVAAMAKWQPVATAGRGGSKQFDFYYRKAIYGLHSMGVPKSAVGPAVVSIVKLTAPWLDPVPPSLRTLSDTRFELRTVVECLGGRDAAAAYRLRMLGNDESSKYRNPAITSNIIVEPEQGAELKVVMLRGVYLSAGGTAEAVTKAIDTKCFGRLRGHLRGWRQKFELMYPEETWTGPDPARLSLARLAGGGALMGDTCNTQRKVETLLAELIAEQAKEVIGAEAWAAMSEAERTHSTRVHKLNCWNHMRNIFLNNMSSEMAKHVASELKPQLDTFSSWERMSTSMSDFTRGSYKEFHHGCKYYKGKGREFWEDCRQKYPKEFLPHLERADSGRQDLDFDSAVPMYIMRPYMVTFLHSLVYGADHSNILEDFLYITYRTAEYVAMTRTNGLIDILISRPLRWLSGNSYKLDNWSPLDMRRALKLVHDVLELAANDGSVLLDTSLDIFAPIARVQPQFAEHQRYEFEKDHIYSPDGTTPHLIWKLARDELLTPADPTNAAPRVTQKTIEYIQVQAKAGLLKILDPKLALAGNLELGRGDMLARADTIGLDATNDRLAESVFGIWDYVLRRNPGISLEAASALVQATWGKYFEAGGALDQLPEKEARALFEYARTTVKESRKVDRADHAELDAYHTAKRKSNSQLELDALVKQYALALSFFDRWKKRGVGSPEEMRQKLQGIETNQSKLDWLREQIEMRVIGLGFDEFKPAWSSSKDTFIGTVDDLSEQLRVILMEEQQRRDEEELPNAAVVPQMRRKTFKELGTPTVQAKALADKVLELPAAELLERARAERERLQDAGEIDEVFDNQPEEAPPCDDTLPGTKLEVRWRYWAPVTAAEKAAGDKRQKRAVDIWCECEAVQVANGTSDTGRLNVMQPEAAPKCKTLLDAGAVRLKWPEDLNREEPESFTWCILTKANWNAEAVLGWRFTAAELKKRREAERGAGKRRRREREE